MSVWLYTIARLPDVTDVVVCAHPIIFGHLSVRFDCFSLHCKGCIQQLYKSFRSSFTFTSLCKYSQKFIPQTRASIYLFVSTCPILYIIKILLYSITLDAVILTILVLRPFLYFSSCSLHRCQTFSSHVVNVRLYRRSIIYRFFCCHFHICISEVKPIYQHPIKVASPGPTALNALLHYIGVTAKSSSQTSPFTLKDQSQESGSQTIWIFAPYYMLHFQSLQLHVT